MFVDKYIARNFLFAQCSPFIHKSALPFWKLKKIYIIKIEHNTYPSQPRRVSHERAKRRKNNGILAMTHSHREPSKAKERDKLRRKKGPLFEWSKPRTTIFYQILNSNSNIEYYPTSYTTEFHNRVVSEKKTSFFIYSFSPLSVSTVLCCRYLFAYLYLISFIWPSTERHSEEREAEVKYFFVS